MAASASIKGSAEEALLREWIGYLAALSGPDLEQALQYKQREAAGRAMRRRWCCAA